MNCDAAIELLPWLANGTLDAGERRQVTAHLRSCAECRTAWAATRSAWQIFDWHPTPAELIAYAEGTEGAGQGTPHAAVVDHLALCASCAAEAEMVRTSRRLSEPATDATNATPATPETPEINQAGAGGEAGRVATFRPRTRQMPAREHWRRYAVAAGVSGLIGLVGLSGWFSSARHANELEARLAASRATPPIAGDARPANPATIPDAPAAGPGMPAPSPSSADMAALGQRAAQAEARLAALTTEKQHLAEEVAALERRADTALAAASSPSASASPAERIEENAWTEEVGSEARAVRGAAAAPRALPVSAGAGMLVLQGGQHGSYGEYALEIRDAQDRVVRTLTHLVPTRLDGEAASEDFYLTLPRGALAPGTYTLQLFGIGSGRREPVDRYSIRVS